MILADSSVWIDHFRDPSPVLEALFHSEEVLMHDFVLGELAMGNLRDRADTLEMLASIELAPLAENDEVIALIEQQRLFSRGVGYVDVHLIASCRLSQKLQLLTRDRRLAQAAALCGVGLAQLVH